MKKPDPQFKGEKLVWRRAYVPECTSTSYVLPLNKIDNLTAKTVEETFIADTYIEGGKSLYWKKISEISKVKYNEWMV